MVWCRTTKGARNPMDPEPTSAGKFRLEQEDHTSGPLAVYAPDYSGERYISHFVTCPSADKHRKKA